jgi:hypothetical protein
MIGGEAEDVVQWLQGKGAKPATELPGMPGETADPARARLPVFAQLGDG